jgi:hypothetical protein
MAVGISATILNAWLNGLCRNVSWTQPAAFWVKLYLGDPGAAGTSNPAANTTRVQGTFSAASGGAITNSAALDWTNVPNAETYSHVGYWDASSAGTFLGSSALAVARLVAVGDNFSIAIGDLDIAVVPVAA